MFGGVRSFELSFEFLLPPKGTKSAGGKKLAMFYLASLVGAIVNRSDSFSPGPPVVLLF
jgi:hypothetical protein